jgi:hypothetical protein
VDLFVSCPLVTVPLGVKLVKVTLKAVDLMLGRRAAARAHRPHLLPCLGVG